MRRLIIILLCGIIVTTANAASFGKRTDERSNDKPAAAQTVAPPSAAPAAPAARFYTPSAPATAPSPSPARTSYSSGNTSLSPVRSSSGPSQSRFYTPPQQANPTPRIEPVRQTQPAPVLRPDRSSRTVGGPSSRPAVVSRPSPYRAGNTAGNTRNRQIASSGSTSHAPVDGSRTSGYYTRRTTDAQRRTASAGQAGLEPANRPKASVYTDRAPTRKSTNSPALSDRNAYRPGSISHSPGGPPNNGTHSVNRPTGSHDQQGSPRTYSPGNAPRRTTYTVGYHPVQRYVPSNYVAPTYRQGNYYYPTAYYPRPCSYGYWAPDYAPGFSYRSVYFSFGLFPYVQVTRISERSYISISYVSEPLYSNGTYYSNSRYDRLDEALADIRGAWVSGRFDLIDPHVRAGQTIAILLDGQYDYTISSDDYLPMTRDAIADLDTVSFVWDKVREGRNGMVTAFGEHSYRSSETTRTVYVSYTLQKAGRDYYITEVGSSDYPLD